MQSRERVVYEGRSRLQPTLRGTTSHAVQRADHLGAAGETHHPPRQQMHHLDLAMVMKPMRVRLSSWPSAAGPWTDYSTLIARTSARCCQRLWITAASVETLTLLAYLFCHVECSMVTRGTCRRGWQLSVCANGPAIATCTYQVIDMLRVIALLQAVTSQHSITVRRVTAGVTGPVVSRESD